MAGLPVNFERCPGLIKEEIVLASQAPSRPIDILVVARDQPEYVDACFQSIWKNTADYTLYAYDNGSSEPTRSLLQQADVLIRSENNLGFILPNNQLASLGESDYIVLLNSDTIVFPGWDRLMTGYLEANPDTLIVGYQGSVLDKNGMGGPEAYGDVDYVCGWCMCLSRVTYKKFGLFDDVNLAFAYAEDSDLCLRVREAGFNVHALRSGLVWHACNVTSKDVAKTFDSRPFFESNHEYIRRRWAAYLGRSRCSLTS